MHLTEYFSVWFCLLFPSGLRRGDGFREGHPEDECHSSHSTSRVLATHTHHPRQCWPCPRGWESLGQVSPLWGCLSPRFHELLCEVKSPRKVHQNRAVARLQYANYLEFIYARDSIYFYLFRNLFTSPWTHYDVSHGVGCDLILHHWFGYSRRSRLGPRWEVILIRTCVLSMKRVIVFAALPSCLPLGGALGSSGVFPAPAWDPVISPRGSWFLSSAKGIWNPALCARFAGRYWGVTACWCDQQTEPETPREHIGLRIHKSVSISLCTQL